MDHVLAASSPTDAVPSGTAKVCVILPAYNAAETIGPLIRQIKQLGLEPIVVNDGSTDRTARVATEAGAFVVSHLGNRGKGTALRSGFSCALQGGFDPIVTMDSDGQHDPQEIPHLLQVSQHETAGIVMGHRLLDGAAMPRIRRYTNRFMSAIVSCLVHQSIPDSQCGFRAIRRQVLETIRLSTGHFDLETELLLAACAHGWKVVSVPIRTIYGPHASHIHPLVDGWRFTCLVLRYIVAARRRS